MKDFTTLKNEIYKTLGSLVGSVKVSLYEDKFYIVECLNWGDFIKCDKLLESNDALKLIGYWMCNCYYVEYK